MLTPRVLANGYGPKSRYIQNKAKKKKSNDNDHAMDGENEDLGEIPVRGNWQTCTGHESLVQPLP